MELIEEFKSFEYYLLIVAAYFVIMNLIGYGMVWLNIPYRKKYKKQLHWIIFVILNFLGGFYGVIFGTGKFKYNKGFGMIGFTCFLSMLGYGIFFVNYLL